MDYNEKKIYQKGLLTGLIIAFVASCVILTTILLILFRSSEVLTPKARAKLSVLSSYIHDNYNGDIEVSKLQEGLYKGLLEGLGDEYSKYYSPEEAEEFKSDVTGEFCGLGAVLTVNDADEVVVLKVYDGSSAQEIGLQRGDIIVAADGTLASSMELSDFTALTRGEEGTTFTLTYRRGEETRQEKVTRKKVSIPTVTHKMLEDGVGYIEISEFTKKTYSEYIDAINDLKAQGARGMIFDLRFNGGGLVDSAIQILDEILPKGTIVSLQMKGQSETVYESDNEKALNMPIAVLVSGRTASAAEIFAAAIKDNNYGTLIGYKTYGKGVVQKSTTLQDGSVVSVTNGKYYTPNGESIHKKGIEPDIKSEFDYLGDNMGEYNEMYDSQVLKAIEVINSK